MTAIRSLILGAAVLTAALLPHDRADAANTAPRRTQAGVQAADTTFAALVRQLSEPGGFFDTDNLISNEASYLHAIGPLRRLRVLGGAYIGVGPDQNFSYIAQINPAVAFIIDIRRDNLLEHLLFKAIFTLAPDRDAYLRLLLGRPGTSGSAGAAQPTSLDALLSRFDGPADPRVADDAVRSVLRNVRTFGLELSAADLRTIERFHRAFIDGGLELQFTSFNRAPRPDYPTLRRLYLETDAAGQQRSFLATDALYAVVRDLQQRNLIIPVVGDLAGKHALAAISKEIARRNLKVSAFYTSNVEFYLMRSSTFNTFAATTSKLPINDKSVIIRSYFGRGERHPNAVAGYNSTQIVGSIRSFVGEHAAGGYSSYAALIGKHFVPN